MAATASLPADAVAAVERVRERERWQVKPLSLGMSVAKKLQKVGL